MLIYEGNLHKKIGVISQLGTEKITFPPKRSLHTDGQLLLYSSFATKKEQGQLYPYQHI